MLKIIYRYRFLSFFLLIFFFSDFVVAQNSEKSVSILFGWNTSGSIELLGKKASAISKIKDDNTIVLDLGSILGPTRIINYDEGALFLTSAREAGIEYLIPSVSEFMFGKDVFRSFASSDIVPQFVSANILDERTRKPIAREYIIKNIGDLKVCIIPISDVKTLQQAKDSNIAGVDIIPANDAIAQVKDSILSLNPNIILVAGKMDKDTILSLSKNYGFIDAFITINPSGGFSDSTSSTNSMMMGGKTVFIGSEEGDYLGFIKLKYKYGIQQTEFSEIILDKNFPPQESVTKKLNDTMSVLSKKDVEETTVLKTGNAVGEILRKVLKADAVFLEKQSLYYFPLADSISVLNVRNIIKPEQELFTIRIKGKLLKSIWEQSGQQTFSDLRLIITDMTEDGRLDSIPVQDDREYDVVATKFLILGGNGYEQFRERTSETISGIDMLGIVENYIVAKEERIKELSKKKIWELNLFLTLNSNFNRTDVDADKGLYGNKIPKPFFDMKDRYEGNFIISSLNNLLTAKKIYKKNIYEGYLKFSFSRMGSKSYDKKELHYNSQKNHDPVELYDKYTYNLPSTPVKPFVDMRVNTFLYSGIGKHPVTASMVTGATRTFPGLMNLNVNLGFHGTRNYLTLENNFGTAGRLTFGKKFPPRSFFTTETEISSATNVSWNPMAIYLMEFKMDSDNIIRMQLWKKINGTLNIKAYSYRNSIYKKVAVGYEYRFTLDYGVRWKF